MHNNDVLRSLRFSLDLDDAEVARLMGLGGRPLSADEARARTGREGEPGAEPCSDDVLGAFLDGLILHRRGPPDPKRPPPPPLPLSNNEILKKLRIALELREDELLSIAAAGGQPLSKPELRALFRKPDQRQFRPAGNQLLRRFMRGLTQHLRPTAVDTAPAD